MCAGIQFSIDKIKPTELDRYFLPGELEKQRVSDFVQVFFWQDRPFLPIEEDGQVHLYDWGNREAGLKMPKTGWARVETVQDGRWDYLSPQIVKIVCDKGYEKKKWFKTPTGLKAIKVKLYNVTRVYLLTTKADQEYLKITGHDRMPIPFS